MNSQHLQPGLTVCRLQHLTDAESPLQSPNMRMASRSGSSSSIISTLYMAYVLPAVITFPFPCSPLLSVRMTSLAASPYKQLQTGYLSCTRPMLRSPRSRDPPTRSEMISPPAPALLRKAGPIILHRNDGMRFTQLALMSIVTVLDTFSSACLIEFSTSVWIDSFGISSSIRRSSQAYRPEPAAEPRFLERQYARYACSSSLACTISLPLMQYRSVKASASTISAIS